MKLLTLSFALTLICGCAELQANSEKKSSSPSLWVSVGANATAIARVMTSANECPSISIDGKSEKMSQRSGSDDLAPFTSKVCEFPLPKAAQEIRIANQKVPHLNLAPKKIVIIGDTGCRVKGKTKESAWVQNCTDPKAWPFLKIAELAASMNPDLVIHVGDYLYREAPCPKGMKECFGSPSGDSTASWNADLFQPAKKLLEAAPWVFVRGNHESCARGGEGFRRMLDPAPYSPICVEEPEPYTIPLEDLPLAVIDTSQKNASKKTMESLKTLKLNHAVLLSHRPLWGDESPSEVGPAPGVGLVFSGHWHTFHISEFEDHRAIQVVTGNSGTELLKNPRQTPVGSEIDGTTLKASNLINEHGFTLMERVGNHWELKVYNLNGQLLITKKLRF